MSRIITGVFVVFLGFLLTVTSAFSADIALVLGNRTYQYLPQLSRTSSAINSAAALRQSGYTVVSARNSNSNQASQLLQDFISRVGTAKHAVVLLNGRFVHSGTNTWFLPVNATAKGLASAHSNGISINLLLDVLSAKPGRAAIFLGTDKTPFRTGPGLKAGIGRSNIPQGVFLATGSPGDIDLTVRRDFLVRGQGFVDALAAAPKTVSGFGFISNVGSLAPLRPTAISGDGMLEEGYWRAVSQLGGEKAMQNYLQAFPNGAHAPDARAWLDGQVISQPVAKQPKDIEAALGLSRTQRRNIQRQLTVLGYNTRGVDGYFGRGSRAAILNWQADQGDVPTGFLTRQNIAGIAHQSKIRAQKLAVQKRQQQAARAQADQAYWRSSGAKSGTESGLRRYLQRYPSGLYSGTANRQLDVIIANRQTADAARERNAWDNASQTDSIRGYQTFLTQFPNGYYSGPALRRLNVLKRIKRQANQGNSANSNDRNYWVSTGAQAGSEQGLRDYLQRYPNGIYANDARARIAAINAALKRPATTKELNAWNIATLLNTPLAYRGFLAVFPDGAFAGQAKKRIKEMTGAGN